MPSRWRVGARACSEPSRAALVLAAPGAPVPALVPCVRVGEGGQVSLPGDTALLVSLIAEASWRSSRSGPVWMVAGIAGGVGVTSLVRLLARSGARRPWWGRVAGWLARVLPVTRPGPGRSLSDDRGSGAEDSCGAQRDSLAYDVPVVIDASGSVPGFAGSGDHDLPGVRWADLEASEDSYLPSLRDHLPVIGGVRALVGDCRGGASADDPRVASACRSIGAPLIVDAGRWDARAARLAEVIRADAIILLTHGDIEGAGDSSRPCPRAHGRGRGSSAAQPRPRRVRSRAHPARAHPQGARPARATASPTRVRVCERERTGQRLLR
mgnify:CR=1 FL=1